ncbi:MAG: hypothetical protein GXO19_02860 [Epsilonproteobacteria bacterium]|nr:hypothetical protein [Campylobacterota bacterium]NPA56660.1 hypothetical protein [Campylobacterota bacterium]
MEQLVQLLDGIKLPLEVPLLLHGPVVHFAIAIPVIALLLEIVNLILRRRCVGVISGLLITLAGLVYLAAFFTGKTDGSEAYSLLSPEGKEELKEHKLLGIYLVYGVWLLLLFKLIFMMIQKFWAKALFTLILAGFVAATLMQGKHGGELVYKYGANVQAVTALDDKVMELQEELKKCREGAKGEAPAPEKKEVSQPAPQPAPKPAPVEEKVKEESGKTPNLPVAVSSSAVSEKSGGEGGASSEKGETLPAERGEATIQQKASEAVDQLRGKVEEKVEEVQEGASSIKALLPKPKAPDNSQPLGKESDAPSPGYEVEE